MDEGIAAEVLHQHWVNSREEDTDTEMVFRPASYDFPRSRGRASFELQAGGGLVQGGIGPTDRPTESPGTWRLEGDKLAFYVGDESEPSRVIAVVSAEKDRLVIRRP